MKFANSLIAIFFSLCSSVEKKFYNTETKRAALCVIQKISIESPLPSKQLK
jgi:hypothetical protein